jgi:hypothetical protein
MNEAWPVPASSAISGATYVNVMTRVGTRTINAAVVPATMATAFDFRLGSINLRTRMVTDPDVAPNAQVGTLEGWTIRIRAEASTRGGWLRVA